MLNLIPPQYRWMAYAAAAAAAVAAFGTYSAWVYGKGKAAVRAEWDAANARSVLVGAADQNAVFGIDRQLQESLNANAANQPLIGVPEDQPAAVPGAADGLRGCARLPAAAVVPRQPVSASGAPTASALGRALAHDADRYPDCVARLDAAQAALRVCQGEAR